MEERESWEVAGKTQINDTQLRQIARFHVGDVLFEVHFVLCVCVCAVGQWCSGVVVWWWRGGCCSGWYTRGSGLQKWSRM